MLDGEPAHLTVSWKSYRQCQPRVTKELLEKLKKLKSKDPMKIKIGLNHMIDQ